MNRWIRVEVFFGGEDIKIARQHFAYRGLTAHAQEWTDYAAAQIELGRTVRLHILPRGDTPQLACDFGIPPAVRLQGIAA